MTTPVINRAELRTVISQTPPAVRDALMAAYVAGGYRPLTDDTWTNDELNQLAATLTAAAEQAGHKLTVPLDTSSLLERIKDLPDDIADAAAVEASQVPPSGLPNVAHANRWTLEHWFAGDAIITHAEELAAARLRHVHAALGQAGVTNDDDRHFHVSNVTAGRTESSRKLTGPEAAHLARWAEDCAVRGADAVGNITAYAPDWKAEAKRLGVTQAELLKSAKEWAKAHRLEAPKSLAEVTGHRIVGALLATSLDGRTVVTEAAEVVDAAPVSSFVAVAVEMANTEEATGITPMLTETQTAALFDEANGKAVAEPAPHLGTIVMTLLTNTPDSELERLLDEEEALARRPLVEPAAATAVTLDELVGALRRFGAARADLVTVLDRLGLSSAMPA